MKADPKSSPQVIAAAVDELKAAHAVLARLGTAVGLPAASRERLAMVAGRVGLELEQLEEELRGRQAGTRRGTR